MTAPDLDMNIPTFREPFSKSCLTIKSYRRKYPLHYPSSPLAFISIRLDYFLRHAVFDLFAVSNPDHDFEVRPRHANLNHARS
jgi:hypothetical protein